MEERQALNEQSRLRDVLEHSEASMKYRQTSVNRICLPGHLTSAYQNPVRDSFFGQRKGSGSPFIRGSLPGHWRSLEHGTILCHAWRSQRKPFLCRRLMCKAQSPFFGLLSIVKVNSFSISHRTDCVHFLCWPPSPANPQISIMSNTSSSNFPEHFPLNIDNVKWIERNRLQFARLFCGLSAVCGLLAVLVWRCLCHSHLTHSYTNR